MHIPPVPSSLYYAIVIILCYRHIAGPLVNFWHVARDCDARVAENKTLPRVPVVSSILSPEDTAVLASSPRLSPFYTEKHVMLATRLRELTSPKNDSERPDKVLFVFSFRISIKCFEQFMKDIGWGDDLRRCEEITGAVSDRRLRVRAQKRINDPTSGYVACFLTPTTGGVGLNLQGANQVVLVDTLWNSALVEQVVCRSWRLGQARNVTVWYLMARSIGGLRSIEESMAMLCQRKERDGYDLMGGKQQLNSSQSKKMVAKMVVGRGSDASTSFLPTHGSGCPRLKHGTFFQFESDPTAPQQPHTTTAKAAPQYCPPLPGTSAFVARYPGAPRTPASTIANSMNQGNGRGRGSTASLTGNGRGRGGTASVKGTVRQRIMKRIMQRKR